METKKYVLVIDTEEYAGSFEREMCVYMTGVIGDEGVGDMLRKLAIDDLGEDKIETLEEIIEQQLSDYGYYKPVNLSSTPGWFNDGFGNFYKEGDYYNPDEVVKKYNEKRQNYLDKHANLTCNFIISIDKIVKHPAYLSIEIIFNSKPSYDLLDLMAIRARSFCNDDRVPSFCHVPKKVTAVRLVERITTDKEIARK